MRAYPANAKNSRPAAWSTPVTVASGPMSSRAVSAPAEVRAVTATAASTARTTTTMTRVRNADFCTPAWFTAVSAATAATATAWAWPGQR